jgi:hypothetical protein
LWNIKESGNANDAMSIHFCSVLEQPVSYALWNMLDSVMLIVLCPFILHSALEITGSESYIVECAREWCADDAIMMSIHLSSCSGNYRW